MGQVIWFLYILLFITICSFSAGRLSGWAQLATQYPFVAKGKNTPPKVTSTFMSPVAGPLPYNRIIFFLGAHSDGLYLSPMFNLWHPPLLIPWDAIEAIYESPSYHGKVRLVLHDPTLPVLLLPQEVLQSARAYLPPSQQEAHYSWFGWGTIAMLGIAVSIWLCALLTMSLL